MKPFRDTMNPVSRTQLLAELEKAVPRDVLIDSEEAMHPFECDGLSVYRKLPLLVALPENTGQARIIQNRRCLFECLRESSLVALVQNLVCDVFSLPAWHANQILQ